MQQEIQKVRKKKYTYFIGIDVSKNTLDYAVRKDYNLILHQQGKNQVDDILIFCKYLKELPGFTMRKALFCMEQSGFYCNPSLQAFNKIKANVVCEHALRIKRSLGLTRGKDDKEDAKRIAAYAEKNWDVLRLWEPRRKLLGEVMHLFALRSRLLGVSLMVTTPLNEQTGFIRRDLQKKCEHWCRRTNEAIAADLDLINQDLENVILSDDRLRRLKTIITSVKGVGPVTAVQIIISTNEFKDISCPKKFACYAGVAPFKIESGLMVKRARVSHLANKRMKSLLHLCALTAIRSDSGLKAYYKRKTVEEGKPKMLVLNAIRCKLIHRIFACVNQDRLYLAEYRQSEETAASELNIL